MLVNGNEYESDIKDDLDLLLDKMGISAANNAIENELKSPMPGLVLDIKLPYDTPKLVTDHCVKCTRCIDACPTKAIVANKVIDARKCISYQTIELKDELDNNLMGRFENRVFGCDICQDVCPWNLKSKPHNEPGFIPKNKLLELTQKEWHQMEKPLFNNLFKNSAVKRTGYAGLKRNLKFIKIKNGGEEIPD